MELTHASFFTGGGGLDLGLERAGWRTVSASEVDPYACALIERRGIPNLGDITDIAAGAVHGTTVWRYGVGDESAGRSPRDRDAWRWPSGPDWQHATLWSGGFPCQDLSIAGKRRGLAGERSGLAFAFLALVERYRPPAALIENVPGLLSSHGGRDMAALLGTLGELGYGWAFRVLDARHFGVPQRRRRVFIVGLRSGPDDPDGHLAAERAASVLSVGARCPGHPPTGIEAGPEAAGRDGVGLSHALSTRIRVDPNGEDHVTGPAPDASRVRAPDGLAGRMDDRPALARAIRASEGRSYDSAGSHGVGPVNLITGALTGSKGGGGWRAGADEAAAGQLVPFRKATKAHGPDDLERWERADVSGTLDVEGMGEVAGTAILGSALEDGEFLPLGLDSHRYRVCGNGVVAPVAEWLGRRLATTCCALAG